MKNANISTIIKGSTKVMLPALAVAMVAAFALSSTAFAASTDADLSNVTAPIISLLNSIFKVAIPLVAAVGSLYCITLGVKYARAEEPQDREKAKQHLKGAITGFVLIFVLVVALNLAITPLQNWMNNSINPPAATQQQQQQQPENK